MIEFYLESQLKELQKKAVKYDRLKEAIGKIMDVLEVRLRNHPLTSEDRFKDGIAVGTGYALDIIRRYTKEE